MLGKIIEAMPTRGAKSVPESPVEHLPATASKQAEIVDYDPRFDFQNMAVPPGVSAQQVTVNVGGDSLGNSIAMSLGVGAMVLGVLSLFFVCVPFAGLVLSVIGLLLGVSAIIVSVKHRGRAIGFAIAGATICIVAVAPNIYTNWAALEVYLAMKKVKEHDVPALPPVKRPQNPWLIPDGP